MTDSNISRLVYLAAEFRPDLPGRRLIKYAPMSELITTIVTKGVEGSGVELDISKDQLRLLYREGRSSGKGSEKEFRILLAQAISGQIDMARDNLKLTEYFSLVGALGQYVDTDAEVLVTTSEASLAEVPDHTPIEKWASGMAPFDLVTGQFYQGLTMLMGLPGHGKTSFMLSFMEGLRAEGAASSIWFYETEIPLSLMLYRSSPCRQRVKFFKDDRIICGLPSIDDILERVKENPDPDRVILIDSPDVIAGGSAESRRFVLEEAYRSLVRLKGACKHVVVASQARRQDRELKMESASESWAKAFYPDIIITLARQGRAVGEWSRVKAKVVKNRFGPVDRELVFNYNYAQLLANVDPGSEERIMASGEDQDDSDW